MQRMMLRGKIHRATVTVADLHYDGSITIDEELMEAAGILPHEMVQVYNVTNGHRFETYAIQGERGSGIIGINGAAAHRAGAGDLVIIASYGPMGEAEAVRLKPRIVLVDEANRIKNLASAPIEIRPLHISNMLM